MDKQGVFAIRAFKAGKVVEVLFNERLLGLGDDDPQRTAYFLFKGNYDAELGFPASECVPPTLSEWNDMR